MAGFRYWLWLTQQTCLTNRNCLALLRRFGTPEGVFYADTGELLQVEGIEEEQAAILGRRDLSRARQVWEDCCKEKVQIVTIQDAAYPDRLRNIYDPPCLLYYKGQLPCFDEEAAVAVVGTRSCTPYGIACAERLSYDLTMGGAMVVSGLAKGIDQAASRGALRAGGFTVGVLGNGVDVCYPYESRSYYEDIAATGVLISEYAPGTQPAKKQFPARNRIISGLSIATLVVEAPERSGALITALDALEQGREVYAVPGPITAESSRGCNRLIRSGAGLVMEAADILDDYRSRFPAKLGITREERPFVPQPEAEKEEPARAALPLVKLREHVPPLSEDEIGILMALGEEEPMLVDDLAEKTELPVHRILSALTMLELAKLVCQHSGKRYTRAVTPARE